jgi:hypothetical protein
MDVPPPMGSANAINFQPTGGGKAAITGDFVLIAKEVNPVLKALRDRGIEVTAIHNHMLDDQPHLFFMHFWPMTREEQRTTFQPVRVAVFVMTGLWLGGTGPVSADTLQLFVIGLPLLLAGTGVGLRLYAPLDEAGFRKVILVFF